MSKDKQLENDAEIEAVASEAEVSADTSGSESNNRRAFMTGALAATAGVVAAGALGSKKAEAKPIVMVTSSANFSFTYSTNLWSISSQDATIRYIEGDSFNTDVTLFWNNAEKLKTTSAGVTVINDFTATRDIWAERDFIGGNYWVTSSNPRGITEPNSGKLGTIQTAGTGGTSGWEGFSIQGNYVFMGLNTERCGIYDNANLKWMVQGHSNGPTELYYNGILNAWTDVNGFHAANNFRVYKNGSATIDPVFYMGNAANNRAWSWQMGSDDSQTLWGYDGLSGWKERYKILQNGEIYVGAQTGLMDWDEYTWSALRIRNRGSAGGCGVKLAGSSGQWLGTLYASGPDIGFLNSAHGWSFKHDTATGVTECVDYTATSDRSLKNNFRPINNALERVLNLKGYVHGWKDENKKDVYGFIHDEVEVVEPMLAHRNKETNLGSVNYTKAVPLLVEAAREIEVRLRKSESENAVLKSRLEKLEKLLN